MKNKSQRGISPCQNFAVEHGKKSIPVITHKNQLTGTSRCFAAKKMTKGHKSFFFLFKFNFNNVFILFKVVSIFCFRFNFV